MPSDPGDELVEVVDRSGRVLEVVSRRRMRSETLRHRCTYVAVLAAPADLLETGGVTAETPVVVHQRAAWKDTYPSYWDPAFGGVCGVGEGWRISAERELSEEAGISGASLTELGPVTYERPDNRVIGRVYVAAWPDPPVCADGEVVAVDQVPLGRLSRWAASVAVCPDSATLVVPLLTALIRPSGSDQADLDNQL